MKNRERKNIGLSIPYGGGEEGEESLVCVVFVFRARLQY